MPAPSAWIPFEWPAAWQDAALLKLLEPGPLNCILFAPDAPAELRAAAEQRFACPAGVVWRKAAEVNWPEPGEVIAIGDAVWPDLAFKSRGNADGMEAGPTGAPWLDANGWLIQMARARGGGKPVWIRSAMPENVPAGGLLLALHEACAYGAQRPLALPPDLAAGIASGSAAAVGVWEKLLAAARWQQARRAQNAWAPFARLLVISDFTGPNEYNASELLNLSARRGLAFRIGEPANCTAAQLAMLRAVLYVDAQPLPAALAAALQAFAERGGLVLLMPGPARALRNLKPAGEPHPRFHLYQCGRGRVAVSRAEWEDPYLLAQDTHLLMSRRYDAVRLFNAGSLMSYHTAAPAGAPWLVHLVNYTRAAAAHQVSLQTWAKVRRARFFAPGQPPQELAAHRETGGSEWHLPPIGIYAAVELDITSYA
jgi:hypothetical protein